MPVQVSISTVTVQPGGEIEIVWDDGRTNFFSGIEEVRTHISDLETMDNAELFLIARGVNVGNDFTQPNVVEGKTLTLDVTANNPVRVQ